HLKQQAVARLLFDGHLNTLRVGDSKVISNQLDVRIIHQFLPIAPIILIECVLDRHHRIF
uniref:Uncharacterized protein n=1 Tax=Parascaris univalens TaxID=6257 RepID=A0A915AYI0_PARUN